MDKVILILEVVLIDLFLSADNAVLISSVTKNIQPERKVRVNLYAAVIAALMRALFISLILFVRNIRYTLFSSIRSIINFLYGVWYC